MVAIVRCMDRKDLIGYPRFSRMVARVRKIDKLYGIVVPEMAERAADEWLKRLAAADIPSRRVSDFQLLCRDDNLRESDFF